MQNQAYPFGHPVGQGASPVPKQDRKLLTEFGRRPAALRTQAGTQTELTRELGISQRMISCYEGHTEYSPAVLLPSLAELLGVCGRTAQHRATQEGLPAGQPATAAHGADREAGRRSPPP